LVYSRIEYTGLKTRLILIVTLLLAAFGGWFYFSQQNKASGLVEALIPATSVGVLSIENPREFLNQTAAYDWWDEMLSIPLLSNLDEVVKKLDSLDMQSDLGSLPLHISLHITGNNQLEPLFLVESKGFSWEQASLQTIGQRLFGKAQMQINESNYLGKQLFELNYEGGKVSFLIEGAYLVMSTNALLVEDVIRAVEEDARLLPGTDYKLGDSRKLASLFLDCSKLGDLSSVFLTGEHAGNDLEGLYVKVGLEATESGLRMDGVSVVDGDFVPTEEAGLNLKNFVPVNASVVRWFGLEENESSALNGFDLEAFHGLHAGDLCLLDLDLDNRQTDRVLLATLKDIDKGTNQLTALAEAMMVQNDTLFKESFMETDIIFINREDLPSAIYGNAFQGFEQTYFTTFNDVLLFGSSIDALKSVLSEYDGENTWGRSIERRRYIDDLVQEASVTTIYNFEYFLDKLAGDLKDNWKTFFDNAPGLVNALDVFSLQVSNTGSGVLMSAAVDFNESVNRARTQPLADGAPAAPSVVVSLEASVNAFADTTLATKAFVVRNHNNNQRELIFQDRGHQLYLASDQGLVQWKRDIGAQITGGISQIDYYNNRKLQYLFFTAEAMHLVDRNGNNVEGFPRTLDVQLALEGHRVVDYDNTRRYRYAGSDRRGNVYLYNKEGAQLEGWNPKAIGSQLLNLPEHVRIRGRDCFLMVERQGTVHLTNRRGEAYPGFPYKVNKRLSGDAMIVKGSDFSRSHIVVAAENGEVLSLDFNGKVVSRNQLLRPNASSRFSLVRDKLDNGYVIARKDADEVVFYDQDAKEMFKVPVAATEVIDYSFYNFRNDSEVLVVHERGTGNLNIYNAEGQSILPSAMAAVAPIGIIYYQNRGEYELIVNFANQMAIYNVPK